MTSGNEPSQLLTDDENQIIFTVIGQRRQTKATAVVQMFHASPNPHQWAKFRTGVVCFVKDNTLRSYYIRMIDVSARRIIFEQELYDQFTYSQDKPYFHSFPGDKFMVGLNFASIDEASKFSDAVNSKMQFAKRATIKRKPDQPTSAPTKSQATVIGRPPVNVASNDPYAIDKKGKLSKPKGGRKLTKADIGLPTDFRHLAHVGWDPATGVFNSSNISPEWKNLIEAAGVSEEDLQDKDTAEFIYNFIEERGGIQKAAAEIKRRPPPPPAHSRGAPPPPPPSRGGGGGGGRRPAPRGGGGPPPPPPPPPVGVPAPPPPPPVAVGGQGNAPTPPAASSKPSNNLPVIDDARGNLMASIRGGFKLRNVSETPPEEKPAPESSGELEGMAGALARALEMRSKVIHGRESDGSEEEDVEGEDDEDWD